MSVEIRPETFFSNTMNSLIDRSNPCEENVLASKRRAMIPANSPDDRIPSPEEIISSVRVKNRHPGPRVERSDDNNSDIPTRDPAEIIKNDRVKHSLLPGIRVSSFPIGGDYFKLENGRLTGNVSDIIAEEEAAAAPGTERIKAQISPAVALVLSRSPRPATRIEILMGGVINLADAVTRGADRLFSRINSSHQIKVKSS